MGFDTHHQDALFQLTIDHIPGINIPSTAHLALSISDLLQIDVTAKEDEEMALNMKNKITPITSPSARATSNKTAPRSAIFNVSHVKKVELGEMRKSGSLGGSGGATKTLEGGNVLRKVASITAGATSTPIAKKTSNIVPEKLNFATVEKFEGKFGNEHVFSIF